MYPEQMVAPMRQDLTQEGVVELRTAEEVDQLLSTEKGTGTCCSQLCLWLCGRKCKARC